MRKPNCVLHEGRARSRRMDEETAMNKKLKTTHNNQEEGEDRISELPEALLHRILSLMPLKCAARTSILSNRWKDLWRSMWAYTSCFDFGEEFSKYQDIWVLVRTIDRYLQLHRGNSIEKFRLYIYPKHLFRSDIRKWMLFASEKGVKELDLHFPRYSWTTPSMFYSPFKLPFPVFTCSYLTVLKLSECSLELPKRFRGFPFLKSLCLDSIDSCDAKLEALLLNCPALEDLTLEFCCFSDRLKLTAPSLTLKSLTLVCLDGTIPRIEIQIPCLLSLHLHDYLYPNWYSLGNFSSLEEAVLTLICIDSLYGAFDQTEVLSKIAHVKILTICDYTMINCSLMFSDEGDHPYEGFPVVFPNLIELQLKLSVLDMMTLDAIRDLFIYCDFTILEKLFIEVIPVAELPDDHNSDVVNTLSNEEEPLYYGFNHLKTIKMNCFRGCKLEMELVKFLLKRAVVLEALVLVASKNGLECNFNNEHPTQTKSNGELFTLVEEQLLLLPRASPNTLVVLYDHSKDYSGLHPTYKGCAHLP